MICIGAERPNKATWTRIVGVQGKHADHLTTISAWYPPWPFVKIHNYFDFCELRTIRLFQTDRDNWRPALSSIHKTPG